MPKLDTKEETPKAYAPKGEEYKVQQHLEKRIPILKDTKKKILNGFNYEELMKDADREYIPHSLREKHDTRSIMLVQDEVKGLRGSRIVPITGTEGQEWRSDLSEPTLLVKVQTALSILIDQNPEAVFKALLDKYKPTSSIAQAIWKRSWSIAQSKEQLKTYVFNLAKYGWAPARTYPRLVQRPKEILTELDTEHPEKNKYKTITVTDFNDIYREALDPWRTWIDDMANLYDPWSLNDWYFEKDFDKDTFDLELGQYANADKVKFGQKASDSNDEPNEETKQRNDIITIGFYENQKKDLYAIYSPNDKVVLYHSPLPNDEGLLSLWDTFWCMRDPRTRYGIGLFEMIKNNKVMYDRLDNMDMDQLVLSIYTMLFYSGSNQLTGDGTVTVSPGLMKQKLPGTTIDQVKIDYSGKGREGAELTRERIDEITGITPTLQGEVEGKTLGEVLHAKDSALKRLNIPLGNIAAALTKDAYLTLSWANQVYSLPEVMEFVSQEELDEFMEETGRQPEHTMETKTGITADFPRVLELSLDEDREGALIEAPEDRFFVVGQDIEKTAIKWKGQITVNPQSIVAASQELDRQRKLELFNVVYPTIQAISVAMTQAQFTTALALAKPVIQILEIQNEKPEAWLPDDVIELLDNPEMAKQMEAQEALQGEQELFVDPNAPPDPSGGPTGPVPTAQSISPIVPRDEITNPLRDSLESTGAVRT